jgi:hypothetical protein
MCHFAMPTIATLLSLPRRLNPWRVRALEIEKRKLDADHERLGREYAELLRRVAQLEIEKRKLDAEHTRLQVEYAQLVGQIVPLQRYRSATAEVVVSVPHLEISLDRFDPAKASETIRRYGCMIARGNEKSRDAVVAYRRFLDDIGYTKVPAPASGALWEVQRTRYFRDIPKLKASINAARDSDLQGDRLIFPIHQLVRQLFFGLFEQYFGGKIMMSTTGTTATIRTVSAATDVGLVNFHQDISPVDLLQCLTFWVLVGLDGAGKKSPGLKFVISNGDRRAAKMPHKLDDTGYHEVDDLRLSIDQFYWTPEINVGDVVIFDPYAPHASYSDGRMTENRISLDLRVTPFDAARANSILDAGHGLVLFNEERMIGPTRLISASPPKFEYGPLGEAEGVADHSLSIAFELAKSTPFGAA